MAAFNPMEGLTVAKNPWRNTQYGKGTHYFRTAFPSNPDTQAQQQARDRFASAARSAASACSGETGISNMVCRAREMQS